MNIRRVSRLIPNWKNALLAVLSAVLLILAFPDFEFWFLAWFALMPLLFAIERETKSSPPVLGGVAAASADGVVRSFILGWLFGVVFFTGTCWWLTYAPIHYAGFPVLPAYFLLFCVTSVAAIFPGIFGLVLSVFLLRYGTRAFLLAPFVWVFTEFLRYWITGNNWNAIGYSQAPLAVFAAGYARLGGVLAVSFLCLIPNLVALNAVKKRNLRSAGVCAVTFVSIFTLSAVLNILEYFAWDPLKTSANVIAVQPNVPMSGLAIQTLTDLRKRQFEIANNAIGELEKPRVPMASGSSFKPVPAEGLPIVVVLPESPMNFMYNDDLEFQHFVRDFTMRNNVSVLFNSAEPNKADNKYFNSAVLVGPEGKMIGQYDKIYLLPFGEAVPTPLQSIVPAFVGSFSYGSEYDLLPIGDAKGGVMICFESHFGELSREYVRNGADVIIEMTNDGYLGPTPVLRQHLANAVFRAVETNRPVLRVTNVGITAYINERGEVLDAAEPYTEATRVWSVSKSDGSQTFYVRYGDWFAWLCSIVTIPMLFWRRRQKPDR